MAVFFIRKSCLRMSFVPSLPCVILVFFSCESNLHQNFQSVLFVNLDVGLKLAEVVSAILTAT